MRRLSLLLLSALLFLAVLSPGPVQAAGVAVLGSSAQVDFPGRIVFNLSAASDVNITDIRLHYTVDYISLAQVTSEVYIVFQTAPRVSVDWMWDMRKTGGMPPGSSLNYWWTLADAAGNRAETSPVRLPVEDQRYQWRSLKQDMVTLYWYKGDDAFAGQLMSVSRLALSRLEDYAGARLERPVKIYIYADARDLQGSMIYPQEWTGGVAFARYGIIAIGIAPNDLAWGSRAIAHELTHLVIHQVTFNAYGDLPTWLDEGLAMYAEGEMETGFSSLLRDAISQNSLISVRSLASPFSAYSDQSTLAYAQSYSILDYLINQYGQDRMFQLLSTFRQGSTYDGALERVYGFDMDGLNARWRNHIGAGAAPVPAR